MISTVFVDRGSLATNKYVELSVLSMTRHIPSSKIPGHTMVFDKITKNVTEKCIIHYYIVKTRDFHSIRRSRFVSDEQICGIVGIEYDTSYPIVKNTGAYDGV